MTMTTGEFDFDSIFRQDPTGRSDDAEEIPFPPISYILWIAFVIIMPILLTNMLVYMNFCVMLNNPVMAINVVEEKMSLGLAV